jgi:N-acetylglucosamine kinase-like BadF-type ATPase
VAIFLGVDGGGNKTTCAVGDEKSVLASATAGGSNVIRVGEAEAREALHEVIRKACAAANVIPEQVERICVGAAGAARPQIAEIVKGIVSEVIQGEIMVTDDLVTALQAAFDGKPGVIVIAGTGSTAYGKNSEGKTARAGGWGFEISDEGSGHWIGRSAVAAVLRAQDEDEASPTTLAVNILKAWRLKTLDELIRAANAPAAVDFAALFPHVLAAADAADPVARTVLTQAGTELARLAKIVIGRIFQEVPTVPVAMSGGVFRNSALVRHVFYNSLRSEYPNATVGSTIVEPVKGALELARQRA